MQQVRRDKKETRERLAKISAPVPEEHQMLRQLTQEVVDDNERCQRRRRAQKEKKIFDAGMQQKKDGRQSKEGIDKALPLPPRPSEVKPAEDHPAGRPT